MVAFSAGKRLHDVIRTADPFPYTDKFMFVGIKVRHVKCTSGEHGGNVFFLN